MSLGLNVSFGSDLEKLGLSKTSPLYPRAADIRADLEEVCVGPKHGLMRRNKFGGISLVVSRAAR